MLTLIKLKLESKKILNNNYAAVNFATFKNNHHISSKKTLTDSRERDEIRNVEWKSIWSQRERERGRERGVYVTSFNGMFSEN